MTENLQEDPIQARLDRIEARLDRLVGFLDEAQPTVGMAADAFDAWAGAQVARGVDLDQRTQGLLSLVERASERSTQMALLHLLEQLPRLKPLIDLATTFEGTTGMLFDMFDAQVAELQAEGIDPEARLGQVLTLLTRLTDPEFHAHLEALLDAAPNLMAATRTGELFGRAIDEVATAGELPRVGLLGLVRALSTPEVQRAAGFAVAVAQRVGEQLPDHTGTPALADRS